MIITTCDKCGKSLEVVANKHIDIIIGRTSVHRREWELDLCTECAEVFDLFLDSFKNFKPLIFEPSPSSCSEDYSDDEVVNQAVDVWGGAGPDCSSKRVTPVEEVKSYNKCIYELRFLWVFLQKEVMNRGKHRHITGGT